MVSDRVQERYGDGIGTASFDQGLALTEGWCVIKDSSGFPHLQGDDEAGRLDDDEAFEHVVRLALCDSVYHRHALNFLNEETLDCIAAGADPWDGVFFMEIRTWRDESVIDRRVVKVRADLDLPAGSAYDGPGLRTEV